ncbi:MAG: hypothetical protein R3C25_02985 [Hyphomonadaceae bacterium]
MRFALIATSAAAMVTIPLAIATSGPQMTQEEFLGAVRCAAYEDVAGARPDLAETKYELNAESQHQPASVVAVAQAEVAAIAHQAVTAQSPADAAFLRRDRTAACTAAAAFASSAIRANAV